jgi:hypothetical protein
MGEWGKYYYKHRMKKYSKRVFEGQNEESTWHKIMKEKSSTECI